MEKALLILFVLSLVISIGAYSRYLIHMFQLNSYKAKVQFKWLLLNKGKILGKTFPTILTLILVVLFKKTGMVLGIIFNLTTIYINKPLKAKLPLVYTLRIKRLISTITILLVGTIISTLIFRSNIWVVGLSLPLFFVFSPLIIIIANFINRPMEKIIGNWYIKDGKKKLESVKDIVVIGITGSYGKTSVKFYLSRLLSAEYNVLHTPESYNTPMGVTKTLREQLRSYHEVFICEMGAKQEGDIKEICEIVKPDHGIITSIGPQHLESFKTIENIIKTKFELGDNLKEGGKIFLNYDNEYIRRKEGNKNIISYGLNKEYRPLYLPYNIETSSKGSKFTMISEGVEYDFATKLIGRHNVENIVGAIAVARELGISMEKLVRQVRLIEGVENRLQLIKRNDLTIIDDCYNSNPMGAKVALETLNEFQGIKILMTPGMVELGNKQYDYNKEFGCQAARVCDYVVLVGEEQTKAIYDGLIEGGFPMENIYVAPGLQEGFGFVDNINSQGEEKILLMENDLPDNF